jgi:hypothetical protein
MLKEFTQFDISTVFKGEYFSSEKEIVQFLKKKSIPYRETVYIWKGNTSKNYDTFKKSLQCLLIDKDGDIRKLTKELGLKQQTTLRKVINEGDFSHPLFYEMEKFFDVRFILGFTLWIS